ncbi:MAG: substrate-binding periplasmic protein, partial [Shewanella sp.]
KRSHQMLKLGTLDLMMGATQTPARQVYAHFSAAYRDEALKLFANAKGQDYRHLRQWEDIFTYKLRLLVPVTGWYGKDYANSRQRLEAANLLILSPDLDKSLHMLGYGRADILIGDAMAVAYIAKHYSGIEPGIEPRIEPRIELVPLDIPLERSSIHLMLSKISMGPLQLAAVNQAIHALTQRGAIAQLQQKWQPNNSVTQ